MTFYESMIFKVQLPIVTSEDVPCALVYDKRRKIFGHIPLTKKLRRQLRNKLKSFWHGHTEPDPEIGGGFVIQLDKPAKWQEW